MKKLIFLLILLPNVAFSQENLKESAETFVSNFFKNWENKKWDDILNSISEDGSMIGINQTSSLLTSAKSGTEYYKNNAIDYKAKLYSVSAEVLCQTIAEVTVRGLQTENVSGESDISEFLGIFILERIENNWKFKTMYNQNLNPFILSDNIEKKWQTGRWSSHGLLNGVIKKWHSSTVALLSEHKKDGTNLAQLGKTQAAKNAKGWWGKSKEFSELVAGFNYYVQCYSPYVEVLERNENVFKARYKSLILPADSSITKQEYLDYIRNYFGEMSSFMEGTCSIIEDGEYLILTVTKK